MTTIVFDVPGTATDNSLPDSRDPVYVDGVKFLFDLAYTGSWAKQADPANLDSVLDIGGGAAGSVGINSGQAIDWVGNMFDFTGATNDGQIVKAPAGVLNSIWSGANDYFMVVLYGKLPTAPNWNTDAALAPLFCATTHASGYQFEADLLTIAQNSTPNLTFRRQTNGGSTVDQLNCSPAGHYGLFSQIAFYRNAAGQGARIKTNAGATLATAAVGANNSGDFSAKVPRWGITESFNDPATKAAHVNASKWALARGWIEDLSISGRDPITVLDADWARTVARAVFS